MNREEELLGILQEEAAEVIQAISKCNRFGKTERNIKNLETEIGDFMGVFKMLIDEKFFDDTAGDRIFKAAEAKVKKVEKFILNKKA
jgi:NTP pyrophosphatase (non-canonical NTP hydrolase)